MTDPHKYASPEQLRYARVLGAGVQVGFVLLVVSFLLYMAGVLKPLVPLDQVPKYWGLSAAEYVKATGTPTGWAWLKLIAKGDMLNLVGIVVLAGISAVSTLAVLPIFTRRREKAHIVISILLIVVLVVSASNILSTR
ncbi:MAG TPA: hypothetical protein VEP67_07260 [Thiobacillaceae bacterium]|nr:hypothetical protein [Thiobacillaceae bacterium]